MNFNVWRQKHRCHTLNQTLQSVTVYYRKKATPVIAKIVDCINEVEKIITLLQCFYKNIYLFICIYVKHSKKE